MTDEDFKESGYTYYPGSSVDRSSDVLFQKHVRDGNGRTKYFVNAHMYRTTVVNGHEWPGGHSGEVAPYPGVDRNVWVVDDQDDPPSVEAIEDLADLAYRSLGCVPDRCNQ